MNTTGSFSIVFNYPAIYRREHNSNDSWIREKFPALLFINKFSCVVFAVKQIFVYTIL
jgi:hypothetical protein